MVQKEVWVNVPVVEHFAETSPYHLTGGPDRGYVIVDDRTAHDNPVRLPAQPRWYSRLTSRDVPMERIGQLQGTYLGIYINPIPPGVPGTTRRRSTAGSAPRYRMSARTKPLSSRSPDVIETCWAARTESGVTFVHLNGGVQLSRGLAFVLPYVKAIEQDVGMLVGVQLAPEPVFARYDALIEAASIISRSAWNCSIRTGSRGICPGKDRMHGQELFVDAMNVLRGPECRAAHLWRGDRGHRIIERTLEAIDLITSLGAFRTVCIFRPTVGSACRTGRRRPTTICGRSWRTCTRRVPASLAAHRRGTEHRGEPVVNPDDVATLAEPGAGGAT